LQKLTLLLSLLLITGLLQAQTRQQAVTDSLARKAREILAEAEAALGSDSTIALIDSLLAAPATDLSKKSQLALRTSYNSNITSAGRPFEVGKYGLSGGATYYHRSGLFADLSGYYSQQYDPDYFLTMTSVGYMYTRHKRWSLIGEYTRYFYNLSGSSTYVAYNNNFTVTAFAEIKKLNFRLDYSFYFGDKQAHRLMPGIFLNIQKRNWHKITRISILPSFYVLAGTEQVTTQVPLAKTILGMIFRQRHGLPLFETQTHTVYGIMNYSLSLPILVTVRNWTFNTSYTYNIPKALPGETLTTTDGGFLSLSITRFISMR